MSTNALTRRNNLFPSFADEFSQSLNNLFDNDWDTKMTIPAVNVTENNNGYNITVAAPGMKKEDFRIDVNGRQLTISAETEQNKEDKEVDYTRREYNYSSFSRSFTLPDGVNEDKIAATYENGILKLSLPKKEEAKKLAVKTIEVK